MELFLVTTDQENWERFLDYSDFSERVKSSQVNLYLNSHRILINTN